MAIHKALHLRLSAAITSMDVPQQGQLRSSGRINALRHTWHRHLYRVVFLAGPRSLGVCIG